MRTMKELTELIETDSGLHWPTLTILNAFHLEFKRLSRHVAQPEDHLEWRTLYLAYWNDKIMFVFLAIRSQFFVESVKSGDHIS